MEKLGLTRTLGVEWEVKTLGAPEEPSQSDLRIIRGLSPGREEFTLSSEILGDSNFPTLFSFYGRDNSGSYREHFIPNAIAQHEDWKPVLKDRAVQLKKVDGGFLITNFTALRGQSLARILDRSLSVRGRDNSSLLLKKSTSGWNGSSDLDRQIPETVSEEWRGDNTFVGFEFPMHGGVESWRQIEDWYKNLWWRLGLLPSKTNEFIDSYVSNERDHIHWRTNPMRLPSDQRAAVYSGLIGFWGDRNDSSFVSGFDFFQHKVAPDGSLSLSRSDGAAEGAIDEMSYNYSLCPLTRSLFARVSAAPDGIHISDRMKDLDPKVDHSVPPAFKRLFMGIRGGVDVAETKKDAPITVVELEARSTGVTTRGNLESLPSLIPGTNHVDIHALQQHASPAHRGLLDTTPELEARARAIGVPMNLILDASKGIDAQNQRKNEEYRRYIWRNNQILATYFIPLNDWISHPVVHKNLSALPPLQREFATQRYLKALQRYKERMTLLDQARKDKKADYMPDWLEGRGPRRFADGSNRFFPQGLMNGKDPVLYSRPRTEEELGKHQDHFSYPTDPLILSALEIEMMRFVSESGLANLLRF